jgi:hypothetical protein
MFTLTAHSTKLTSKDVTACNNEGMKAKMKLHILLNQDLGIK